MKYVYRFVQCDKERSVCAQYTPAIFSKRNRAQYAKGRVEN